MSNSYGDGVWRLDTAGAVLAAGSKIKISKLVWYPNAADNDIDVTDGNATSIFKTRATIPAGSTLLDVGKIEKDFGEGCWFDGFDLETIDGGLLEVFYV